MAEVYPLRGSGEYAGSMCEVNKCKNYARFQLSIPGDRGVRPGLCCGHHVGVVVKGMWVQHGRAVIAQEIPGNWWRGSDTLAAINGEIVKLGNPGK